MPLVCVDNFFELDLPFLLFDWLDVFSKSSSPALEHPHELTPIVFISKNLLIKIKQWMRFLIWVKFLDILI